MRPLESDYKARRVRPTLVVTVPIVPIAEMTIKVLGMYRRAVDRRYEGVYVLRELRSTTPDSLGSPHITLDICNSSFLSNTLIDEIVKPFGIRVPSVLDLSSPEISIITRGSVNSRGLVLRSTRDSEDSRNNKLIRELAQYVDMGQIKNGKPALITGFKLRKSLERKGFDYGLCFVPADDFAVIYDDRLTGRWNDYKFDEIDENGLPLHLDRMRGERTWLTRNDGLSGLSRNLCLTECGRGFFRKEFTLNSGCPQLDYSGIDNKVVLVPANYNWRKSLALGGS